MIYLHIIADSTRHCHKLLRWVARARLGQFLGFSPKHSSTVGIIRNIETGYCSTQFHVVFDQLFTTVASNRRHCDLSVAGSNPASVSIFSIYNYETWMDLLSKSRKNLLLDHNEERPPPAPCSKQKHRPLTPSTLEDYDSDDDDDNDDNSDTARIDEPPADSTWSTAYVFNFCDVSIRIRVQQ
jgi:hypothetical protein